MATIPFRKGYTIVPYEISSIGLVTFTDGTNTGIIPNQNQCEAYGYTYDEADGVCRAQPFTQGTGRAMANINNTIKGSGNELGTGINNTIIIGENNTLRGKIFLQPTRTAEFVALDFVVTNAGDAFENA